MRSPQLNELPPPCKGSSGWLWTNETKLSQRSISDDDNYPLITVVTPSYNQAEFLEETIRSVVLQGYPNIEYMVLDGGSTDGSVGILETYAPWISWWQSKPDEGQADAINIGFQRASGEILAFLNSDDVFEPGTLLRVAEDFRVAGNDRLVHVYPVEDFGSCAPVVHLARQKHSAKTWLIGKSYLHQPGVFWSRQAFDAVGGFDVSYRYVFDRKFFFGLLLCGFVFSFHSGPPVTRFRWHPESKTFTERSMGFQAEIDRLAREMGRKFVDAGILRREETDEVMAERRQIAMSGTRLHVLSSQVGLAEKFRHISNLVSNHPEAVLTRFFWATLKDAVRCVRLERRR